ncbi:hypothetical protein COX18_05165 [Candidatus Desantisbacteria bacterium CG23_combo_of_CG06-09_8_20_14_all_40_23]|uniref:Uncharacterized protein n=1 Tax=Candidatus Desantisbacteria bacterium CG23_combo_of_CG06-09_8_20_14_all_40_23 TaxID=1974550 RepID=A0A2H0A8T6_9BACT|nr:MAG: hypothetical protein COX18_05165 [Candidatus Desantisbacteria bacterium CG23_combo_of_CG06-09_8_20_14_all_40_23]
MNNLINLDNLPINVKESIVSYASDIVRIYQDNLKSIVIYGSATQPEDFSQKHSNINLLIILNEITLAELKKAVKLVNGMGRKKKIVPLFLTMTHIQTSIDVFPVEFLEMKENNVVIYGEDVFEGMKIRPENIRLQCEEQIKGKIIRLRQAYLELSTKPEAMEKLMAGSLTSLLPIFRNILRIKTAQIPPIKKGQIIDGLAREYSIDTTPLLNILESKNQKKKIPKNNVESVFEQYLEILQGLAIAVDQLKVG